MKIERQEDFGPGDSGHLNCDECGKLTRVYELKGDKSEYNEAIYLCYVCLRSLGKKIETWRMSKKNEAKSR